MGKRAGTIAALLITAALFLSLPGLWQSALNTGRVAPILQTPRQRTLTVWLCPDGPEDRKLLSALCAQFEKENRGARVFLRRVTADELYAETAVLPDVLLFATGEVLEPEGRLLPLARDDASGMYAGRCYAAPLWYATPASAQGVALQQMLFVEKGLPMPATSDRVRYAAICRQGEDAQAFVQCLQQADPMPHGLRPAADAAILPNAFAHTRQELLSICLDAYQRREDPAQTLLRLR